MSTVVETVTELVKPILAEHNFYLYDMEFVKEGKSWYLRVYIDKDGGITLNDCATVSDQLNQTRFHRPTSWRFHLLVRSGHCGMKKTINGQLMTTSTSPCTNRSMVRRFTREP